MAAIRDTRVDVCLYFIPPHRLRQASCLLRVAGCGRCWLSVLLSAVTVRASRQIWVTYHRGPVWPAVGIHVTSLTPSCSLSIFSLQIDLQFITELAQEVPVVPVLAKADTMTAEELKARAGASNRVAKSWAGGGGGGGGGAGRGD